MTIELSDRADGADPQRVASAIQRLLRTKIEIFVPAVTTTHGTTRSWRYLVDGYAFVRYVSGLDYNRLTDQAFTAGPVFADLKKSRYATISDAEIEKLRAQASAEADQGIGLGDSVTVTEGVYSQITCQVVDIIDDSVTVHVKLRSTQRLVTLPRAFLQLVSRATPASEALRLSAPTPQTVEPDSQASQGPQPSTTTRGRRRDPSGYSEFGRRLDEALGQRTATDVAGELQLSRNAISRWMLGRARPRGPALARVATILGVRIPWLRDGAGPMRDPEPEQPASELAANLDRIAEQVLASIGRSSGPEPSFGSQPEQARDLDPDPASASPIPGPVRPAPALEQEVEAPARDGCCAPLRAHVQLPTARPALASDCPVMPALERVELDAQRHARIVRRVLAQRGLSRAWLRCELRWSWSRMQMVLNGRLPLRAARVEAIADALEVEAEALV